MSDRLRLWEWEGEALFTHLIYDNHHWKANNGGIIEHKQKKKKKEYFQQHSRPLECFTFRHITSTNFSWQLFILHCTKFGHFWEKTWKPENLFAVFQGLCSKSERRSSGQMRPICHIMACIKKCMQAIPSTVIYSTTYYCNTQYVAENTHY